MIDLKNIKKVHFVGIGGIGMSALARFMVNEGKEVSGSDASDSDILKDLKHQGIEVYIGHSESQVNKDTDLVVYTIAAAHSNPELSKARDLDISIVSYPEMLGIISRDKFTVAISGTHGKTTTTAMLADVLCDADKDPTVIVGSLLNSSFGKNKERTNFISGDSDLFVVEACEYKRSFLNLSPNILVITNIDNDHLDYYEDISDIKDAFRTLAESVPKKGYVICDISDKNVQDVVKNIDAEVIDYKKSSTPLSLKVAGKYNKNNARAALSTAELLGVSNNKATTSLEKFEGVWRRMEKVGTYNGKVLYDDYAHHPTEIKASLVAIREKFPDSRITVIFQPHLYSRTKELFNDFSDSFFSVDEVLILPIYAAREAKDPSISSDMLVKALKENSVDSSFVSGFDEVVEYLDRNSAENNIIITMGAGDVYKIGYRLCK